MEDEIIHRLYKYRLSSFELISPEFENPVDLVPGSVNEMFIKKNYDDHFYPILMITFSVNPKVKEFIEMRKNDIKFHIGLRCEGYDTHGSPTDPVSSETVFDTIFIPVISSSLPFMDTAIYNDTVNELRHISAMNGSVNDLGGHNFPADSREQVSYFFYVEKDLFNSKNIVNKVYANTDIPTICADLLSKNGFDAILMSPPENTDPIDQCIIQPQNLLHVFEYLSNIYGMHKTGTVTFFDYRGVYILNKSGHPDCVEEGEYPNTIFKVYKTKDSESWLAGTGICDERKEYYIYPDPHRIVMKNPSAVTDHITGNNLSTLDAKDNLPSKIWGIGLQRGSGITRVENNANINPYMQTQYINDVQERNLTMNVTLFDVYMWALTPNKEFTVQYVDSNIDPVFSGCYRIKNTDFVFNKNGEQLTLTANVQMVKKESIDEAQVDVISVGLNKLISAAVGVFQNKLGGIFSGF